MPALVLGVLQILPSLLQTGFSVLSLVNHTNANSTPSTPVEDFAAQLMAQLPALINAGIDILMPDSISNWTALHDDYRMMPVIAHRRRR